MLRQEQTRWCCIAGAWWDYVRKGLNGRENRSIRGTTCIHLRIFASSTTEFYIVIIVSSGQVGLPGAGDKCCQNEGIPESLQETYLPVFRSFHSTCQMNLPDGQRRRRPQNLSHPSTDGDIAYPSNQRCRSSHRVTSLFVVCHFFRRNFESILTLMQSLLGTNRLRSFLACFHESVETTYHPKVCKRVI
ncbi:uncharacterized protein EV420DRAFT_1193881 [Desarmillaria tabescens]|uniref:Uncharacterized protein n=1 Tax=Armillaria tabescens TaxID=1929756 RepID=A0AA39NBF2_ARMTA|nr:uncharacterized protein EV420DRAFT_1193881 [Desarmillaria tabescens]KAK0462530.1 hypothetical protein EV420DRAFT_1193881 [Desarmillaria tabescens]